MQQQVRFLDKAIKTKAASYLSNLKTITTYLQRLQKMILPSDQNFTFNSKVLGDLVDLCTNL